MEPASAVLGVGFEGEVHTDHVVNSDSNKLFTYLFKPPSIGLCKKLELQHRRYYQFWCLLQ